MVDLRGKIKRMEYDPREHLDTIRQLQEKLNKNTAKVATMSEELRQATGESEEWEQKYRLAHKKMKGLEEKER